MSFAPDALPISTTNEQAVACGLATYLNKRLAAYKNTLQQDLDILADPKSSPRAKVAARLTKIEKSILKACLDAVAENSPCTGGCAGPVAASCFVVLERSGDIVCTVLGAAAASTGHTRSM